MSAQRSNNSKDNHKITDEKIPVLLADDHSMVLDAICAYLDAQPQLNVVGVAHSADQMVVLAETHQPRVVVMDINMPGIDSFHAAHLIKRRLPKIKLVFLTAYTNDAYIEEALSLGAAGYVTKREPLDKITQAICDADSGEMYLSEEVWDRLVVTKDQLQLGYPKQTRGSKLTSRQREVLRHIAAGLSRKAIAAAMNLSPKTVARHTENVMDCLGIHDRVGLANYAIRERIIEM